MTVRIETKRAQKRIEREIKKIERKSRSKVASAINKELRTSRRDVVEELMTRTGLKRKILNDRMVITRASPKKLEGRITPIFGRRIYMMEYPWARAIARAGKKVIRLMSPIYRKNMRTAFISKDGSRMYLRHEWKSKGKTYYYARAVKGRSVPRLFDEAKAKAKHEPKLIERILKAVRNAFK
ncbi:hypothetical protein [Bdellovibrio bacteriovorus]|uniref:hypothetical protein n=1 Tax=Bdellovibrio bacteriovorus TaxID=959 RepID=UPI0035A69CBD